MPWLPKCSLLRSKFSQLHLTQNQDDPVVHPPENLTNFHHLRSLVDPQLYHSPHHPLHNLCLFASCEGLAPRSCTKWFFDFLDSPIVHKLCKRVQLWEIIHVPCMKSSISIIQCCTLYHSITSHATLTEQAHFHPLATQLEGVSNKHRSRR